MKVECTHSIDTLQCDDLSAAISITKKKKKPSAIDVLPCIGSCQLKHTTRLDHLQKPTNAWLLFWALLSWSCSRSEAKLSA